MQQFVGHLIPVFAEISLVHSPTPHNCISIIALINCEWAQHFLCWRQTLLTEHICLKSICNVQVYDFSACFFSLIFIYIHNMHRRILTKPQTLRRLLGMDKPLPPINAECHAKYHPRHDRVIGVRRQSCQIALNDNNNVSALSRLLTLTLPDRTNHCENFTLTLPLAHIS